MKLVIRSCKLTGGSAIKSSVLSEFLCLFVCSLLHQIGKSIRRSNGTGLVGRSVSGFVGQTVKSLVRLVCQSVGYCVV